MRGTSKKEAANLPNRSEAEHFGLIDLTAIAFVVMSVAFAPVMVWVLISIADRAETTALVEERPSHGSGLYGQPLAY